MKLTDCGSPDADHEDHRPHDTGAVCWAVVRMYIAAFRRGVSARLICHEWGYKWTKN